MRVKFFSLVFISIAFIFLSADDSSAADYTILPSQCTEGGTGGQQTGCIHDNDKDILKNQCSAYYKKNDCASMPDYLNAMAATCRQQKEFGNSEIGDIDCNMIPQNGYYGREASKFASYEKNTASATVPAVKANSDSGSGLSLPSGSGLPDPAGGFEEILGNALNWLLGIIGIIALISFIISGLQYFFAAGDERKVEAAKKNLTFSIIGIIVALSGYIIIQAIESALDAVSIF
jgi:hypothetical protein